MRLFDKLLFPMLGMALWAAGTILYELRGHHIFEASSQRYWINFVLTPVVTAALCILILKWRHTPPAEWSSAALLIALPGMFGEAALLSRFAAFMPRMRPETAGRYGAFLFATYALFLTIAEIVTLRAANGR
jgi:cytochrome bd-type quinol oxidase subunit 2